MFERIRSQKIYLIQELNLADMSMTNYAYETSYSCTNETVSGVRIPQLFETSHLLIVEKLNSIKCWVQKN